MNIHDNASNSSEQDAKNLLCAVWHADESGNLQGVHFIAEPAGKGWRHHPVKTLEDALAKAGEISAAGSNAYFACAEFEQEHYVDTKGKAHYRTTENARGAWTLWLDTDCGETKAAEGAGYLTQQAARDALKAFCLATGLPLPNGVVNSGNGLHVYWVFIGFIPRDEWQRLAGKLKKLAKKHGFLADPARTADIASVLRVPGTMNFKDPGSPKPVKLLRLKDPLDLDDFKARLAAAMPDDGGLLEGLGGELPAGLGTNIPPREYPPSSSLEIVKHCPTLAHIVEEKGNVSEPLWRAGLGVLKHTTEGEPYCHEISTGHPKYDYAETQSKIDNWKVGPTLCETFRADPGSKCAGCAQTCKSPISLGYSNVVGGDEHSDSGQVGTALQAFNDRYFVARVGGGVFVFDERDKNILAAGMAFTAFKQLHACNTVAGVKVADKWLCWSKRRTYESITFDPTGPAPKSTFNIWRGLAVQPVAGDCALILEHIRVVWAGRNVAQFDYIIKWLALLVQQPWNKPEVALVLRSREGTGKTIIVEILMRIFGTHAFTAAQKEQVAGRFNGHLFDKVLVVLEEAFFAGDPAAVATTKALVTNQTLGYEAKGKDAFSAPNYAHVISLTNHGWAVPAGEDSRRWMVLDVDESKRGDHAYFSALANEIENGGVATFLQHLLSVDLNGWNPRALPESAALRTQQLETLMRTNPVAGWWFHTLAEGAFTVDGGAVDWAGELSAADMQESYTRASARARSAPNWDAAAKELRKLVPGGALGKVRKSVSGGRQFYYNLPELGDARAYFKQVTGVDPCAE